MSKQHKVRIVLPVYNRGSIVAEAIESALQQAYGNWELIAVDDGSTDETWQVLTRYQARDPRIRAIRQVNAGAAAARNRGLDAAGEFDDVAFLDSDDVWSPNHLRDAVDVFEQHPHVGFAFGRTVTREIAGTLSSGGKLDRQRHLDGPIGIGQRLAEGQYFLSDEITLSALLSSRICPHTPTVVIRHQSLGAMRFDPQQTVLEDVLLWCRLAHAGTHFVYFDEPQATIRHFGDGLTTEHGLRDPRTIRNQQSVYSFGKKKLKLCRSRVDRKAVQREIADSAYLLGQCYGEQRKPSQALRAYMQCLRFGGGWPAVRSIVGLCLPARLKMVLRPSA